MSAPVQLTRAHRVLIAVVASGAVIIAGIGFAGSYTAVSELAAKKGFGTFSPLFPIGIDAGICVLLALDLLLTWTRIPLPLLRHTAWLLTTATIAFNAAAAWPDPLATGMHAVIPVLFVVAVEAARHAIGRIADITADQHMEGVRLTRWLLSPVPTFLLWRRMKLWEQRSYDQAITLEQERRVYQARLRARYGRAWRHRAPVEALMPLRLARHGLPLTHTIPAGPAAADPAAMPPPPIGSAQRSVPLPEPTGVEATQQQPAAARASAPAPGRPQEPHSSTATSDDRFANPHAADAAHVHSQPATSQHAPQPRDRTTPSTTAGAPLTAEGGQVPPLPGHQRAEENTEADTGRHAQPHTPHSNTQDTTPPAPPRHQPPTIPRPRHTPTQGTHPTRTGERAAAAHPQPRLPHTNSQPATHAQGATRTGALPDHQRVHHDATHTRPSRTPQPQQPQPAPAPTPSTSPGEDKPAAHDARLRGDGQTTPSATGAQTSAERPVQAGAAAGQRPAPVKATAEDQGGKRTVLTTVDRYYLAWSEYHNEHGHEPTAEQLSAHLAQNNIHGRGGKPVHPSTLRRYLLSWRVYNVWSAYRTRGEPPTADTIAHACTTQGITAQYNRPVTTTYITDHTPDYERRWHTLNHHQQPTSRPRQT